MNKEKRAQQTTEAEANKVYLNLIEVIGYLHDASPRIRGHVENAVRFLEKQFPGVVTGDMDDDVL